MVIYRSSGDILHALSTALRVQKTEGRQTERQVSVLKHTIEVQQASTDANLTHAAADLNEKIHTLIPRLRNERQEADIRLQKTTDPQLWYFMTEITKSVNECRGRAISDDSESKHTKKLRQFFSLCVLLFTTNSAACQCALTNRCGNFKESWRM